MIRELRGYDPKPGLKYGGEGVQAVVPDLYVRQTAKGWAVEVNSGTLPRLLVNRRYYTELATGAAAKSKAWLSEQLAGAIADDLVGVHVGLGAGAGLPDAQGEVLVELAGDRSPYICQSQSVNIFLPANVHKRMLHQIHFQAWKKGVKSLYYCRSMSIQRAEKVDSGTQRLATEAAAESRMVALARTGTDNNKYEECLACQ